jgi:hypothetical protein
MPTDHIVSLLIAERDKLNRAIEALKGAIKHRGRRPKSAGLRLPTAAPVPVETVGRDTPVKTTASAEPSEGSAPVTKRQVSAAARRKMAAAQKKR